MTSCSYGEGEKKYIYHAPWCDNFVWEFLILIIKIIKAGLLLNLVILLVILVHITPVSYTIKKHHKITLLHETQE